MTALSQFEQSLAHPIPRQRSRLSGVDSASVNLSTERASVTFKDVVDPGSVLRAIEAACYHAKVNTHEFGIEGMTCTSCVARVEKALKVVPGVIDASVNLATERATVHVAAGAVQTLSLEAAVRNAGYDVQ
ncbi:heavy-metal-associated domain-containing protein [Rhizobium grahamii]|uniref:Putative copper-transporting P-type ATPase n=1 Tax=Rhizobium grahamii CCGE 502 TaxID=990285 RepID=S3IA98_9HYPH|nr:heavy metal-associated domain-containing protein [Rhizobium grahamii]EPE96188.1 putative copper-transporting P-type ATPase [Rhizobium grahamii CCGE 502]